MSNITISASLSTTIDGQVFSSQAANAATAMRVLEITSEVGNFYRQLIDTPAATAIFYLFINKGNEDAILQISNPGPSGNWRYCIPAGGHVVISGASAPGSSSPVSFNTTQLSARVASGTTRIYCLVAFQA